MAKQHPLPAARRALDQGEIARVLRMRGLRPLLNNHKWVKLFAVLAETEDVVGFAKMIDSDEERSSVISGTEASFDRYPTTIERFGGHFYYAQIEYLAIPERVEITTRGGIAIRRRQVLGDLESRINRVGRYQMERKDGRLIIYGYV